MARGTKTSRDFVGRSYASSPKKQASLTRSIFGKSIKSRVTEPLCRNSFGIHEHCKPTGNPLDARKTEILATVNDTFIRRAREAVEIELPNIYEPTLAHNAQAVSFLNIRTFNCG